MTSVDLEPVVEAIDSPASGPPVEGRRATVILGLALVVVGGVWLLTALDVLDLRMAVVLPVVLGLVGVALVVGAWTGPHPGLVAVGTVLAAIVIAVAVMPTGALQGGVGDRSFTVTDAADLESRYGVVLGNLDLDLGTLDTTEPVQVAVSVGAGTIRVRLPAGVPVSVDASVGAGELNLLGEVTGGIAVTDTYLGAGFDPGRPGLALEIRVGAGEIEVTR